MLKLQLPLTPEDEAILEPGSAAGFASIEADRRDADLMTDRATARPVMSRRAA